MCMIDRMNCISLFIRGCLDCSELLLIKCTFSGSHEWPLYTGLTVEWPLYTGLTVEWPLLTGLTVEWPLYTVLI
jgi:hypothetical protein